MNKKFQSRRWILSLISIIISVGIVVLMAVIPNHLENTVAQTFLEQIGPIGRWALTVSAISAGAIGAEDAIKHLPRRNIKEVPSEGYDDRS